MSPLLKYGYLSLVNLVILTGMLSCKKDPDRKIRHLETKLEVTEDPRQYMETTMQLHRLYSLYQIQHPGDTGHLLDWAEMAREGREYEIALGCYDQYLDIHKDPAVSELRGHVKVQLGFFEDAAQDYQTAATLTEDPDDRKRLLQLYKHNSGVDSLLGNINDALKHDIKIPENRLRRAGIYLHNGHPNAAKVDIDKVMQDYPGQIEAWYFLALLKNQYKDHKGGLADLEHYFELAGENHAYYSKAQDLRTAIHQRIKLTDLHARLNEKPSDYSVLLDAGRIYFELKEYQDALGMFSKAISVQPDSLLGWIYRGQARIQLGRLTPAMQDLEKALELDPENISAHNLKAYVHLLKGETEQVGKEVEWIRAHKGTVFEILDQYLSEQ